MTQLSTKYIEMALGRGESEENIKETLRMQGISEVDIAGAFKEIQEKKNAPQPPKPIQPTQPPKPIQPIQPTKNRMEYSKKSSKKTVIFVVIILLLGGVATGGYYYFNDIVRFVGLEKKDVYVPTIPVVTEPVVTEPVVVEEEILSEDEKRINAVKEAQIDAINFYATEGIYPETSSLEEPDFYCYRKEGTHYILGTVLEEGNILLDYDLDGSYVCGDVVKNCADPVYCVGPEL